MISTLIISIINIFLSPLGIIFFLLFTSGEGKYFESVGGNTSRLKLLPFLIHQVIFTFSVLMVTYLWSIYSYGHFSPWEVFVPKYYWVSVLGWMASGFVLKTYLKGMEGNVMGFIFFPILLITSLLLLGVNLIGFFSTDNMENLTLDAPEVDLNIWLRIILHSFLPVYVIVFLQDKDLGNQKDKFRLEVLLGSVIFQLICYGVHWVVFWVMNIPLSFTQYFGGNQNMFYYLPMVVGMLYFLLKTVGETLTKTSQIVKCIIFVPMSIAILLEVINYAQFLKANWIN